jgi:cyclic pyranopterin phosphate synthase
MPEAEYVWLPREDLLHFEEISTLVDVFIGLGVDRIRLTGGEPLLRRNLSSLVEMLAKKPGLNDLALTSNGILLSDQIAGLKEAGLRRITVSLDTLHADRFVALTRYDELARVREGIAAATRAFGQLKIDTVVIKGVNDDELVDLIEFGKTMNGEVRFIEYMDVGGATHWSPAAVLSRQEMLERLTRHYGRVEPIVEHSSAPADRYASSLICAASPAPASTATRKPCLISFSTTSGTVATRFSPGKTSRGTPINDGISCSPCFPATGRPEPEPPVGGRAARRGASIPPAILS